MIDSVCLCHAVQPRIPDRELMLIGARRPRGRTAYVLNPSEDKTIPALTWQTQPNGIQYLSARFSLPRQRWGHNAKLPASQMDLYAELGIAAEAIYRATGFTFNPLSANVTDVHYARDLQVGAKWIRPILDCLETRHLPRHKRVRFDNGVSFNQSQSSTQIYGKLFEVQIQIEKGHILPEYHQDALEAAEGVLRVEHRQQLPAVQRFQTRQGLSRAAEDVLTPDASKQIIENLLDQLDFWDAVENAEVDRDLDRLIEHYGDKVAIRLIGFLTMVKYYGPDFWRLRDYSRRTYYDNLALCRAAGVWGLS